MDGILIIDKPAGLTSHDVVARVRRILKTKRVGHTGTLDPFATGVMVILVGQATRLAQFLDKDEKEYEAIVRFGYETDTGDLTGQMQNAECRMQNAEIGKVLATTNWNEVFADFRGQIEQTPPMYSAKKIDGKKLYELARKGETVERNAVAVTVHQLEIIDNSITEDSELDTWNLKLSVACSAGTYIRTLAEDIGRKVGVGAHLAELRRTRAGKFGIEQSITLETLEQTDNIHGSLIPMETAVSHLAALTLNADRAGKTRSGLSTRIYEEQFADGQSVRMIDENDKLIAIGVYDETENCVRPKVVLV